ncbi:hypothetical protein SNOG_07460 [Parastagonospora nodorum SN15]|uniref:Chitin biosynthesis protein CHS5 n=1 Tax=Phaeosphaeria nodorum (strain SN15 / ATCC MYA-4574 / FGSC 10173) TaxID=321614 RepID=Q0ULA4_PHANO|nr:hypothetical protein SNOG_07460 [Parastagonospora nodorum SN15]EAT84926.2 hypothetical protein SNOG_07460 [Parastagonospora nodorum SN15]
MLVSLTVGKVDAGVAVLLTEDKRLIEFPSILLPPDISSGSIVDINVGRNYEAEADAAKAFHELQSEIFRTFGQRTPTAPNLRCRNATQTSVVLEWDPIDVATAELRSLTLYRNGSKAGTIPKPGEVHSTKLSGLAVDSEYTFHLVLKTSAGTFSSEKLNVQTHKMTDLSGITITPGHMPAALRESLQRSVERIGAKIADNVRIDTTHFVCTEGRGPAWEKAVENNIPVVVPDWVIGDEDASAPPPPPPKDDVSEKSRTTTPEPKSQAEEQKVRTEDVKPQNEKEKGEGSEDESEPEPSNEKSLEAGIPSRPKPGKASVEDEEGDANSFQEVDL